MAYIFPLVSKVFFIAGFETSSSTLSFCLYELAKNADIQKKVQNEIDEIKKKHANQLSYDAVSEMKYLDWCIDGDKLNYFHLNYDGKFLYYLQKHSANTQ